MKLSIRNSLYLAAVILLAALIVSQFPKADLIWQTIMVLGAVVTLFLGYREDKKLINCIKRTNSIKRIIGVVLAVLLVFSALGFAIGKLIYLWTH